MTELFAGVLERGAVRSVVSDTAWLEAMLAAEVALAGALADVGRISASDAEAVEAACGSFALDPADLGRAAAGAGNPVVPLAAALREVAPAHLGATSQDILDSALMVLVAQALPLITADLLGAADAAGRLAAEHRGTTVAARTLLQQAVPTTFGLKAASWMQALDAASAPLTSYRPHAQLGGAAGTMAAWGDDGPAVVEAYARRLQLASPVAPWHTDRTLIGSLAGSLGVACGVVGKVATDIALLAQNEVAEVSEAAPGGSSAMPHKRNPVAAISARACAQRGPGLVATLLGTMAHEHERAAGSWHAEWLTARDLLVTTGSGASWLRASLEGLRVDSERMRSNVLIDGNLDVGAAQTLVDRILAGRGGARPRP